MLHRTLISPLSSFFISLLFSLLFLGALATPVPAQDLQKRTNEYLLLMEAEFLELCDDVHVMEWFSIPARPDSPLKNEDVRGYRLSNGQKGYIHVESGVATPDRPPKGLVLKVDLEKMAYHARALTPKEMDKAKKNIEIFYKRAGYK